MLISKQDRDIFKKLGISSILDLSLVVPSTYENLTLADSLYIGTTQLLDVTIKNISSSHIMKLDLFSHNIDRSIKGTVFNPKYYHIKTFKVGSRYLLYGKIEKSYGQVQIVQPKVVSKALGLVPKYKTPVENITFQTIIKRYLTLDNLAKFGIKEDVAKEILLIHNPTIEFFLEFIKRGGFWDKNLKALKYIEVFNHILKLSKLNTTHRAISKLDSNISEFIDSLPFDLTGDQKKVIEEIRSDLALDTSARRVIMGDVGSGKTIVILASVMISYPKKSILLAPTTILASQIYQEAKKLLPKEVKIAFISNRSKKEDLGKYDFIVGTHALLYRDLPQIPLVMIDEQHRFGTKQREMIKQLVSKDDKHPHFLQFSATPIPRTMAMIESNYIDISTIKELPYKKDIYTKILSIKDFNFLTEHIQGEIDQDRQTIVVYPLVEESEVVDYQSIDEARGYWEKSFKGVYITYGKDKNKESILEEFRDRGSILIATTLIEVGISLPRLSTIVIVAPERLGLATLHQLRGRVSRNGLKGYCYLFTKKEPTKRLKEFCSTLDGFEIAELDLKFRESGDLLKGEKQSGREFHFFSMRGDEYILDEVKRDWE
jgi:ATP-dependent DNA helicase RecG